MTTERILMIVLRETQAIAQSWRESWAGFDGRQLRSQIQGVAQWAELAKNLPEDEDYTAGTDWARERGESGY